MSTLDRLGATWATVLNTACIWGLLPTMFEKRYRSSIRSRNPRASWTNRRFSRQRSTLISISSAFTGFTR